MRTYHQAFQDIADSANALAQSGGASLELQQTGAKLNRTLAPCMKELQQATAKLLLMLEPCQSELSDAIDIWLSKEKIRSSSPSQVFEEVGYLTGLIIQIKNLEETIQQQTMPPVSKSWRDTTVQIRKQWFIDGQTKKIGSVSGANIEEFTAQLYVTLKLHADDVRQKLNNSLNLGLQTLKNINFDVFQAYLHLLDSHSKDRYKANLFFDLEELNFACIEEAFFKEIGNTSKLGKTFNESIKKLTEKPKVKIKILSNPSIFLEDFEAFCDDIDDLAQSFMEKFIKDCLGWAIALIEALLSFYNDFLHNQRRYEKETQAQRENEKEWITDCSTQLSYLQKNLRKNHIYPEFSNNAR